jgi:hypothetical protein
MSTVYNPENDKMNNGNGGMNPQKGDQKTSNQSGNTDAGRQGEQGGSQVGTPGKSTTDSQRDTDNRTKPQQ